MNIKITKQILEAMDKALEDKSLTIPQMADAISISRTTLWRVFNKKSKTMTPDAYQRLQSEFLYRYLPFDHYVLNLEVDYEDVKKSKDITAYKEHITHLLWEIGIIDRQLKDTTHDMHIAIAENIELKSKLNKINKLSSN